MARVAFAHPAGITDSRLNRDICHAVVAGLIKIMFKFVT